jgi:O-antigen ligase
MLGMLNRVQTVFMMVMVPLLIAVTWSSYDALMSASDVANLDSIARRMEFFGGTQTEDEAAAGRLYGAAEAWKLFLDSPVIGRGIGATRVEAIVGEGPHNMYLMLMAEQGFVGLALYPALVAILWRRGRKLSRVATTREGAEVGKAMLLYAVFMLIYGFFSHNVFEEPHDMFILAFITAAALRVPREVALRAPVMADFRPRDGAAPARQKMGQL